MFFAVVHLNVESQPASSTITMPTASQPGQYPLIDVDPHFSRVVRYFRPSDYAAWGALSAGTPALYYAWGEYTDISQLGYINA